MEPTLPKVDPDATLEKAENEVAPVLAHQKRLLRFKNSLCSPLLRLPIEAIVHILSYLVDHGEYSTVWHPIFSTCHRIYTIMRTATELWWKVNCRWAKEAHIVFLRSKGSPRVIIAELSPWNRDARTVLDHWREKQALHGHNLRRLELCGYPSDVARFQWIFDRALPRLNHLKIHFAPPLPMPDSPNLQIPITLNLPTDMPLRILDLRNIRLAWSSNLFVGLSELRMDFKDCDAPVEISEEELVRILGGSPQLEWLSLVQVRPRTAAGDNGRQSSQERMMQLPRLAFLELDNSPEAVGYILAHIDIPAITSLRIRSPISSWGLARSLDLLVPDHRIQKRLFSNPSVFEVETVDDVLSDLMIINIGSFRIWFDFDLDDVVSIHNTIMGRIQPLVPSSVTGLNVNFSDVGLEDLEWREFLRTHGELRSIECSKSSWDYAAESLWEVLSPSGADGVTLCPLLESISLFGNPSGPLAECLLDRKNAGFQLKHLRVKKAVDRLGISERFKLLVESVEVEDVNDELAQEWRDYPFVQVNDELICKRWSE